MTIETAREKISAAAASYAKLRDAYKRHLKSLGYRDGGELPTRMADVDAAPEQLLTAHAGVMDRKSQRCKTMLALANEIFRETGLPRKPEGKFRGENGLDKDALEAL